LCSLLYTFFSLVIHCSFSITFFALILLWTSKLQKCAQLPITNANHFQWLLCFFLILEHPTCHIHFFIYPSSFN
jgi:hypothetical protein